MMKKKSIILLVSILTIGAVAGASVGITYATSYSHEPESYTFDGSSENVTAFSVGHYFHGGSGTSDDPFLITNSIEMRNFAKLQNYGLISQAYYYKLRNSFNWTGDAMEPIGVTGHAFTGQFNGGGMTISGLLVSASGTSAGLFGVTNGANIHDLILSGPTITCEAASSTAGFVCGTSTSATTVTNVYICGGSAAFTRRAKLTAGTSGSVTTVTLPYVVGSSSNFTVTTSGFVTAVDSTSTVYTTITTGSISTITAGNTKSFYANTSGIVIS